MIQNHRRAEANYDRLTRNRSEFQACNDVNVRANSKIHLEKNGSGKNKPCTEHNCSAPILPLCPWPASAHGTAGNPWQKQGVLQPQKTALPTHHRLPVGWPPYKGREKPCSFPQRLKESWKCLRWPATTDEQHNTVLA